MFLCKVCGSPVSPGMAFCPNCGADVVRTYEAKCPKCGSMNPAGSRFCATCGNILEVMRKPRCAICGAENMPGSKYCVSCGAPIVPDEDTHSDDDYVALQKKKQSLDILEKERLEQIDKEVAEKKAKIDQARDDLMNELQGLVKDARDELDKKAVLLNDYREKLNELGPEDITQLKKISQALKSYAVYYSDPSSTVSDDAYEGEVYVCPVCGTINPADIPACTHCGRNKARSIILLKKGKIAQASPVKREIDIIPAPQADLTAEPHPSFEEYSAGKEEPVPVKSNVENIAAKDPNAQNFNRNMPYGTPGVAPQYPQYQGQQPGGYAFYGRGVGDPYQRPPILQPVAFVPYVTQEQPLMQYTPQDSMTPQQNIVAGPVEMRKVPDGSGKREINKDDNEI